VSDVELTNEFLQILEKTPSRLKRIRNWRVGSALTTGVSVSAFSPSSYYFTVSSDWFSE
jgi:cyclin T